MEPVTGCKIHRSQAATRKPRVLLKIISLLVALITVLAICVPEPIRGQAYAAFREIARSGILLRTHDMHTLEGEHFIVKYRPRDREYAGLVLESAEHFYKPVAEKYSFDFRKKIPVIIYPSKKELNASFGWSANESAMGVYWAGAIRVLSPAVWVVDRDPGKIREAFFASGPMAHEFTHLVVDYATRGNCPRWFTEGLAQYEEYRLTGFRFTSGSQAPGEFYPLVKMDREFDALPDQSLAYRESLSAVEYIVAVYGEETLHEMIKGLKQGHSIIKVMEDTLHTGISEFEESWRIWAGF